MFRFSATSTALILVVMILDDVQGASRASLPKNLATKSERFFSAEAGYENGDLLTKSQLKDLQSYLRRTQGHSLATHLKWRSRMLKDQAPLAKKFRAGGAVVLRQVAAELGGYEELDRFSRSGLGRNQIQQAIDAESPASLLKAIAAERERIAALPEQKRKRATLPTRRIYTVADLMKALMPSEPKLKTEPQPSSPQSSKASVQAKEKGTAKNAEKKRQE